MKFFKTFLACLLAMVVGSIFSTIISLIVFFGVVGALLSGEDNSANLTVKPNSVLHLDFSSGIADSPASSIWSTVDFNTMSVKPSLTTRAVTQAIDMAAGDPNIKGIFLDIPLTFSLSTNAIYEIRTALDNFRATSGKFVVAYSDYYSQGGYWLSSKSDVIYMNPYGAFQWQGLSSQIMFYKNTFDKFGIEPEIFRHGRYKSAIEPYILDKMSDDNRHQMTELLGSMWGSIVSDVSASSGVDSLSLQQYANTLALTEGKEALESTLIDSLGYRDQAVNYLAAITEQDNGKPSFVKLSDYAQRTPARDIRQGKVALLYADGAIYDVSSGEDKEIIGNTLAREIEKLRRDDKIKAVVLRVNSPGGSVLASDIIYDQMVKLRKAKPVVVSMGDYAASGGYYISCAADEIMAAPTTLTGSIGVFGMMFNLEKGAKDFLGLNVDVVQTNDMADLGNIFRSMTSGERHFMQRSVDSTYVRFVGLVAQGRGMSYEAVDSIAQGRVWTGTQALENGLVDRLGTLDDALLSAANRANLIDGYQVDVYPKVKEDSFSSFLNSMSASVKGWIFTPSAIDVAHQQLLKLESRRGVQARMPYDCTIDM